MCVCVYVGEPVFEFTMNQTMLVSVRDNDVIMIHSKLERYEAAAGIT